MIVDGARDGSERIAYAMEPPVLSLDELRQRLARGEYRLSDHALRRVIERNISSVMIREAGANAEMIEDYPGDKYSPSCLLLGYTDSG